MKWYERAWAWDPNTRAAVSGGIATTVCTIVTAELYQLVLKDETPNSAVSTSWQAPM